MRTIGDGDEKATPIRYRCAAPGNRGSARLRRLRKRRARSFASIAPIRINSTYLFGSRRYRLAAPQVDAAFPMSSLLSGARLRAPLHYVSLPIPGDECETWTREQLVEMNAR